MAVGTRGILPAEVALVALGGAAGTAARVGAVLAVPDAGGLPTTVAAVNVVGSLLLGLLVGLLVARGDDTGPRRRTRLLLGVGVLGGFTTYSTFAVDVAVLLGERPGAGLAYALGCLVAGWLAALAGLLGGRALAGRSA
ncbi:CrcB family protein [Nocardioides zeae]|uniref:Fluoride-specific ion channel FluC n=1 Tax=Nocardioides imazamoxiresistens TaxID=3231893 RepID=A0ABU3PSP6_9ACTN|nr:CrcB family protein [Nocardioides zeae]MDT9592262.1 CrcB family protein [Nocardioides zeae]